MSLTSCGGGGSLCSDCQKKGFAECDATLHVCANVTRKCDPTTCPTGCCEGNLCLAGTDQNECGLKGQACNHCQQQGVTCQNQACTNQGCNAQTCKGCCFGNQCVSGLDQTACGFSGMQCQNCQAQGAGCMPANGGGMCEGPPPCGPQSCPGCCQNGACMPGSDIYECGLGGSLCLDCWSLGAICDFNQCQASTCDSQTCASGCCDQFGKCEPGFDNSFCGFGGHACQDCLQLGETCSGQTCQNTACGPQSCPSGCCNGGICLGGSSDNACGIKGQQCMNCAASGLACNGGMCGPPPPLCDPMNCPTGCCSGNVCAVGTGDNACGVKGGLCQDCQAFGEVCSNGGCVPPPPKCNAQTCPSGCCAGDVCAVGSQDNACGVGGAACTDCTAQNATCTGGKCVPNPPTCTPQNCPGCCDATGVCQPGFLNNQCGQNGASCANCTAQGSTCDTAVAPRVCSSQQSTCPAAYTSCPGWVSTPVLPVQHVCATTDLTNARAACSGGAHTAACQSFLSFEQSTKPACAKCIMPFDYDFQEGSGLFECVAPYVGPACDYTTGCFTDCEAQSCAQCDAASLSTCQRTVRNGQCQAYFQQSQCVFNAFFSSASFCNPQNYGGNYGAWLEGVGGHYCGP
jgi:hypothetical protein